MSDNISAVILAAGKGTRLKVDIPKPLCPIRSKTLVDYVVGCTNEFVHSEKISGDIFFVTGHERERVESTLKEKYSFKETSFIFQKEQLGTGHALQEYFNNCKNAKDFKYTLVLCADTPLLSSEDLSRLYKVISKNNLDAVAATFCADDPAQYGRIVRGENQSSFKIVEYKDASEEIRKINEVNSGLYIFKTEFILDKIYNLNSNNKSNEFYLTDMFQQDYNVEAVLFENESSFMGVNDLSQLEQASLSINREVISKHQSEGVIFLNSVTNIVEDDVTIGKETTIYPGVMITGNTKIGSNVIIEAGSIIKDSTIADNVTVKAYSYIEKSTVQDSASIGPFAHLRPDSNIGTEVKVGNFVEVKKSELKAGSKVSHLSYVGDAEVGENTNIGCGFITCNYDGKDKHKTTIGKNSFIGSDSQAVAPVNIGDDCFVASGSTINKDMPNGSFAISRTRQTTLENQASKFLKSKKK